MPVDFKKYSFNKALLALSGGPDSMALFYLLKQAGLPFEVAHIDHGARDGSSNEAKLLMSWVDKTPFHLRTLKKEDFKGNFEAEARDYRLNFLKETAKKIGADTIFLAHHADDLAETVLKKVLEGVSPVNLQGMKEIQEVDGLKWIRPFLHLRKRDLREIVGSRPCIEDHTNLSDSNLRGRMRTRIFPYLEDHFKKNPIPALISLSEKSSEINRYLERKIPFQPLQTEGGWMIDLNHVHDPFEREYLIGRFLKWIKFPIHNKEIKAISEWIELKKNKIYLKGLLIDKGTLTCKTLG